MEEIRLLLQEALNGGFWHFVGYWVIIWIPFRTFYYTIECIFKYFSAKKNGYPPEHCDSLGNFKKTHERGL